MPAVAHFSSCPWPPTARLRPPPPVVSSASLIGMPPPSGMTSELPLTHVRGFSTLGPLGRWRPERPCGIRLSPCELRVVRTCVVALEQHSHAACAIDDGNRRGVAALVEGRLRRRRANIFGFENRRIGRPSPSVTYLPSPSMSAWQTV